jgi:hypothetical protein
MLAGKKNIINIIKNIKNLNEEKDERRALKGLKNLWLDENTTTPYLAYNLYRGRFSQKRCCICSAALLPCAGNAEFRPVALRPTLSSGLPFTSFEIKCEKYQPI